MLSRKGFSLVEVLLVLALLGVLLGLTLLNLRPAQEKAHARGLAHKLAGNLAAARSLAMSSNQPVGLAFPSQSGANALSRSLYLVRGDVLPRITRVTNFAAEDPTSVIFCGIWALDGGASATLGGPTPGLPAQRFQLSAWQAPFPDDPVLVFLPSGAVASNLPLFDQAYHVVTAQGAQVGSTTVSGQACPELTAAREPYTVTVSLSGDVHVSPGLPRGSSVASLSGAPPVAVAPAIALPSVGVNQPPAAVKVRLLPSQNPGALPPGVDALLPVDGYLTLEATCTDPDGDPLTVSWTTSGGQLSRAEPSSMRWDAVRGLWLGYWAWAPPPGDPGGGLYSLTATVSDPSGASSVATFGVGGKLNSTRTDKLVFIKKVVPEIGLPYQALAMCNPDGTESITLTDSSLKVASGNPQWSPDGQWILFNEDAGGNLCRRSRDERTVTPLLAFSAFGGKISDLTFRGDGTHFYVAGQGRALYEVRWSDLSVREIAPPGTDNSESITSYPLPPFTILRTNDPLDQSLEAVDPATGALTPVDTSLAPGPFEEPSFSPSGRMFAWGDGSAIMVADYQVVAGVPGLTNPRVVIPADGQSRHNPVFSPDETQLEFQVGQFASGINLWRVSLDGSNLCQLTYTTLSSPWQDDAAWSLR